jgi:transcriptional regulator of acetoin/glycerol metabolism
MDPGVVRRARSRFFDSGVVPRGLISSVIERSWQRSSSLGVPSDRIRNIARLSDQEISLTNERYRDLVLHATPVMELLYLHIANTRSMVILSDAKGLIIRSIGDPDFISRADQVALRPGVSWAESHTGTNAIGTSIAERLPVVVYADEHFVERNNFLTCSAAPIFDPYGSMMGVLDITGDYRVHQHHTIALVRIAVQMIESQIFSRNFKDDIVVRFHRTANYLDSPLEAKAVFSPGGLLIAANAAARALLGLQGQAGGGSFADHFDMPFGLALAQCGSRVVHSTLALRLRGGTSVYAQIDNSENKSVSVGRRVADAVDPRELPRPAQKPAAALSLDSLAFGDERMQATIAKAKRILGKNIPLLIEGESGTGKELLAKAIHDNGPRRLGPFVAVNCAAIPEGLIESELFGYMEGAFTSAKRKGNIGRIQQADGGTLFLDEIGDMPQTLQARLLRVLQERSVVPLGSPKSIPVDITVVCATHRHIRDLVATGSFREDLYYRLNGLTLMLPPLRERSDLEPLIQRLIAIESSCTGGDCVRVAEPVMALFRKHPWPGNIRELQNVIRTAIALTGDDRIITLDCLPDDFVDELREEGPCVGDESAAPAQPTPARLDDIELHAIRLAIEQNNGNISAAARQLGTSRNTLYRKLKGL